MVMSAIRPPLAARRTAIRRSASCVVWLLTQFSWQAAARAANPAGSRTRAISADKPAGVAGAISQPRLGRITSAQTSIMIARPASSETCSGSRGPRPAAASHPASSPRPRGIARGAGPAGDPPVLPGVTRLLLQPVQHPDQATAALLVQVVPAGGERRREQPSEHLRFGLAGQRPAGRHRPRRELPQQRHRRARARRQRPRPLIDRRSRPGDGGRAGWPASAAHLGPCPNSTFSDSGRYPAAAPAPSCPAGGRSCLRA